MRDRRPRPETTAYDGPWSNLPPEAASTPRRREPLLRLRKGEGRRRREPFVRNWKGMAIIVFLLFIAPPLCGWLSRLIMSAVAGG